MEVNDKRIEINGLKIYPFTSDTEILDYIGRNKCILVAVNSKKIKGANEEIRRIVNGNLGYVDGAGAQIALRHKGVKNAAKIPGCELWLKIIQKYAGSKTFYLVGGKQAIIDATVAKLKKEFPGINISGYRNGYLKTEEERNELIEDIAEKKPDVVFVAMGSPTQEYLMQDIQKRHDAIYQGLGGSFDVYTGNVRRAPKWFSNHGIEGVYRAFWEPRKRLRGVLSDIWFLIALYTGKY